MLSNTDIQITVNIEDTPENNSDNTTQNENLSTSEVESITKTYDNKSQETNDNKSQESSEKKYSDIPFDDLKNMVINAMGGLENILCETSNNSSPCCTKHKYSEIDDKSENDYVNTENRRWDALHKLLDAHSTVAQTCLLLLEE